MKACITVIFAMLVTIQPAIADTNHTYNLDEASTAHAKYGSEESDTDSSDSRKLTGKLLTVAGLAVFLSAGSEKKGEFKTT